MMSVSRRPIVAPEARQPLDSSSRVDHSFIALRAEARRRRRIAAMSQAYAAPPLDGILGAKSERTVVVGPVSEVLVSA